MLRSGIACISPFLAGRAKSFSQETRRRHALIEAFPDASLCAARAIPPLTATRADARAWRKGYCPATADSSRLSRAESPTATSADGRHAQRSAGPRRPGGGGIRRLFGSRRASLTARPYAAARPLHFLVCAPSF